VLAKLGDLNELDALGHMTRSFRDDLSVRIINGSITWWDKKGVSQRKADGIHFYMAPHTINGHQLTYYELKGRLLSGSITASNDFIDEAWFATDDNDMISLYSGKTPPVPVMPVSPEAQP
jgi:hypothetical protein